MADRPADFTDEEMRLAAAIIAALKHADPQGHFDGFYSEEMIVDGEPEEINITCEIAPLIVARYTLEKLRENGRKQKPHP